MICVANSIIIIVCKSPSAQHGGDNYNFKILFKVKAAYIILNSTWIVFPMRRQLYCKWFKNLFLALFAHRSLLAWIYFVIIC